MILDRSGYEGGQPEEQDQQEQPKQQELQEQQEQQGQQEQQEQQGQQGQQRGQQHVYISCRHFMCVRLIRSARPPGLLSQSIGPTQRPFASTPIEDAATIQF